MGICIGFKGLGGVGPRYVAKFGALQVSPQLRVYRDIINSAQKKSYQWHSLRYIRSTL